MMRTSGIYQNGLYSIEYSISTGEHPILVMHGGHSNCNENLGYTELEQQGYSLLTPSRPGYGRTSAELGIDLNTASQAYHELLNHLELDKVHVIGISAGGPSALYFTTMFPDRVKSLTLQSAVTKEWLTPKDKEYKAVKLLFHPVLERYTWKLISFAAIFPKFLFKQMARSFSKLTDDEIIRCIDENDILKFKHMIKRQRSGKGFFIDLSLSGDITQSDLLTINCPTLIIHSQNDKAVSVEHAHYAHKNIINSELCILNSWGHLIWLGQGATEMNNTLINFLQANR